MTRPRFSLRGLLLLTAAVAAVCWYRDLPQQKAARFTAAIQQRDYELAETMLTGRYRAVKLYPPLKGYWVAIRQPQTAFDWLAGRAFVEVTTPDPSSPTTTVMRVTANGVQPKFFPPVYEY